MMLIPKKLIPIEPYKPGKPLSELERELGIRDAAKLASNENPLGPSPKALAAIQDVMAGLHRYPDGSAFQLVQALSRHLAVAEGRIVLGNGSDEIISLLSQVLLETGDEAILPQPAFLMYAITVRAAGGTPVPVPLKGRKIDLAAMARAVTPRTRIIFLTNPHNPTGTMITRASFETFIEQVPLETVIVVDEAYIEFVRDSNCFESLDPRYAARSIVTLRTFSKAYGLAGLRVGYGVMPAELAGWLHRIRLPFNVSLLAQAGAEAALADQAFLDQTVALVHTELDRLRVRINAMGLTAYPTQANFFLIDLGRDANEIFERLLRQGVIVRSMRSYGYPQYLRVSIGRPEENQRFLTALGLVLGQ